jgi:protein-arginine kinase activator protein McsA
MLCDICHEREATIHVNHIMGEVVTPSNFCSQCYEASKPAEAHDLTAALHDGCRYCGGEPFSGGYDPLALMSGTHRISFMCKPCAEEHIRYLREKWPGFGDVAMTREQMAQVHASDIPVVFREVDEHMKKWVADRGSQ